MASEILTINAGSSSLKFSVWGAAMDTEPRELCVARSTGSDKVYTEQRDDVMTQVRLLDSVGSAFCRPVITRLCDAPDRS